jgi:polyphosphate kinase
MLENKSNYEFLDRDISWLNFNYRVLQEAKDKNVPLYERIKFLAIYSSNLGEFFRIRVASHRNLKRLGKKTKSALTYDPSQLLSQLYKITNQQLIEFNQIFENSIIPELKTYNIHLLTETEISVAQEEFISTYFKERLLPFVQPVLLIKKRVRPFLNNSELYLAVSLTAKDEINPEEQLAVVKIPSDQVGRFIILPSDSDKHEIIMLDDIVRYSLNWLFPGYKINNSYSIKLTRDAELYIDDEYTGDLLDKIKKSLLKRNIGPASRLVYDDNMPKNMLDYFLSLLEIQKKDVTPEGRYHNNFDFFHFPEFKIPQIKNKIYKAIKYTGLLNSKNIFENIDQRDHLLYFPFHEYESVVRFFEDAATDPNVTQIKLTQYRIAKKSRIMDALVKAASRGINVFIFIEVKARFDEAANLSWGEEMEKKGIKVRYSFPGLKVHAKAALVHKKIEGDTKLYSYLSTGNFHEQTVKSYIDYGLFTCDERICNELNRFFNFLENTKLPNIPFKHLLVGQFNLNDALKEMIEFEKQNALQNKPAKIILKLNNLQDKEMIELLYDAAQAGVKIKLLVRGICSLVSGKKDLSENIEGLSIVDRYLEHSRLYYFYHDGEENIFLSSADWMERNLHFRIEIAFPVYDPILKKQIMDIVNFQLLDNVKSRSIDYNRINEYRITESKRKVQSQLETYKYYKELQ